MEFLPALTTTRGADPQRFMFDLKKSNIREIAFFPTCLLPQERQIYYRELETIKDLRIYHVHLRTDFEDTEMEYLIQTFKTEVFNIHSSSSKTAFTNQNTKYKDCIYVENSDALPSKNDLEHYAGICPDFAHWETANLDQDKQYINFEELLAQYVIGCCHISAIRTDQRNPHSLGWDYHKFSSLENLKYIQKYLRFLPSSWASLELENSLSEQLEAIVYLKKLW